MKIYGIKRPDGTIVQGAIGDSRQIAASNLYYETDEADWIHAIGFEGRPAALRRRGYSVVEVELVEKRK